MGSRRAGCSSGFAPAGTAQAWRVVVLFGSGVGLSGTGATHRRPNESFKPMPHRYANHMAEEACHVLRAPLRHGLTLVLVRYPPMPYFKVRLSGVGISLPFKDGSDPVIGFFTTRMVRAPSVEQAHAMSEEIVLSEWRPGGPYFEGNSGSLPSLAVEESWQVSLLTGIFGRKPRGYSFYSYDD